MVKIIILFWFLSVPFSSYFSDTYHNKILISISDFDPDEQVECIVVLRQKPNLNGTEALPTKSEKAHFVYKIVLQNAVESQAPIIALFNKWGVDYQAFHIANIIKVSLSPNQMQLLAQRNDIEKIIEDGIFYLEPLDRPSITDLRAIEWGVSRINAPDVWAKGFKGQGVVIGGQDTGYEWDHPALINQYRGWNGITASHDYNWHDAIRENNPMNSGDNPCGYNLSTPCDDNNHGTHTMGTMVGDDGMDNQIGVAPEAKWIGCRNMERGYGTLSTYVECFEWFLAPYAYGENFEDGDPDLSPHVIANSWGCPPVEGCNTSNFSVMEEALNNLRSAGTVIVVSAGNSGPACNTVENPAAIFENSVTVGATNSNDLIANFSSRGAVTVDNSLRMKPDVSAPGVGVRSSIKNNMYRTFSGTSMAGPHVAGAVALMISADPLLGGQVEIFEKMLTSTAFPITTDQNCNGSGMVVPNNVYGYGIIDALAAVQAIENLKSVTWLGIEAARILKTVLIQWSTASEINNSHFIIMRSLNGFDWEEIGKVEGNGTTFTPSHYTFEDKKPVREKMFYRVTQYRTDDIESHSDVVQVNELSEQHEFIVSPNPFKGTLSIGPLYHQMSLNFQLYNAIGQLMHQSILDTENFISVNVPQGIYFYKIYTTDGKFIQSGKLLGL